MTNAVEPRGEARVARAAEVIVALDVPGSAEAWALVELLGEQATFYKVGLELYTRAGPRFVEELRARGKRIFLDLKLHDIPNTVAGAVAAASDLDVDLLTVHVAGGPRMLEAAGDARRGRLRLLGVTVLTSLAEDDLETVWGRDVTSTEAEVLRLAALAEAAGMDGVVASPLEVRAIRAAAADGFRILTPGIRLGGSDRDDQRRVATPADAVRAGSDYLVLGRAVTRAPDAAAALSRTLAEVGSASAEAE
jgi:orotidine-5'-phosphate decarboxylase